MPTRAPRPERQPCTYCRESHLRCDNQRPKCRQCQSRNRDCVRPPKKTVFHHWSKNTSESSFANDQIWVNSRSTACNKATKPSINSPQSTEARSDRPNDDAIASPTSIVGPQRRMSISSSVVSPVADQPHNGTRPTLSTERLRSSPKPSEPIISAIGAGVSRSPSSCQEYHSSPLRAAPEFDAINGTNSNHISGNAYTSIDTPRGTPVGTSIKSHDASLENDGQPMRPIDDIQEACLLRYFIEELAHWFDLCDELRHFQLCVPQRARSCRPLRNAIFSAASRHLSRQPQYRTAAGIIYHGKLLTHLTHYTAVEYMLQCIPALSNFHSTQNVWYQENIMAAAVILRQCEELDDEAGNDANYGLSFDNIQPVNFIQITQSIIDHARSLPTRSSLSSAVLWMALRQEIYYCMIRKRAPRMRFNSQERSEASAANKLIIYAGDVAHWRWGDRSPQEWARLTLLQQDLQQECLNLFVPILEKEADKSNGEFFPTIWYGSDAEVTAVQYFEIARAMLIAEDPNLEHAANYRLVQRRAEHLVRLIILKLCGIALSCPKLPPAFVLASAAIFHYGEFFTDAGEREALMSIIERTKDLYAGSLRTLQRSCDILRERWDFNDGGG